MDIKHLHKKDDIYILIPIIEKSSKTITKGEMNKYFEKGWDFFAFFYENIPVGSIWLYRTSEKRIKIEKLSVLPEYRHIGIGKQLLDYVSTYSSNIGASLLTLGMINSNRVLKEWYKENGFISKRVKYNKKLGLEICFFEKELSDFKDLQV